MGGLGHCLAGVLPALGQHCDHFSARFWTALIWLPYARPFWSRAPKAASETHAEGREKEIACIQAKYKRQDKLSPGEGFVLTFDFGLKKQVTV